MKVYIAAPLFCEGERRFNERIDAILRDCGHETSCPSGRAVAWWTYPA